MTNGITFSDIETALAIGKVEMKRPWGDWVPVRRRGRTINTQTEKRIPVYLENVEGAISTASAAFGYPDVRITP